MSDIKCKMRVSKIMFPKTGVVVAGEYAIFTCEIIQVISGKTPITHEYFKTVSVTGTVPYIKVGDEFTFALGEEVTNNYGTSYKLDMLYKDVDVNNKAELKDYYKTMCGEKIAKELIKVDNAYDLLQTRDDEELLKVKGIGEAKLKQIYKNIEMYSDISYAFVKLEPLGLSRTLIKNICFSIGGAINAVETCMNNPYSLIKKVDGVGFFVADQIAQKCGMDMKSPARVKSAITHVLEVAGESGKSFLTASQIVEQLTVIADVDFQIIKANIFDMAQSGEVVISLDGNNIALRYYIELEQSIAREIVRIQKAESHIIIPEHWREQVRAIEIEQGWEHTNEQWKGIEMVLNENLVVISGKAGSGKSTITNAMSAILKDDYQIDLCCLSAKASQRLSEVTGMDAKTIHRLLGIGINNKKEEDEDVLYSDIIILDEASMVSGTLFLKLLRAVPSGSKLIILGDDGQLTAIGDCAVFSDLIRSNNVARIELTKIHRQAEKSAIITKSIDIRNQKAICEAGFYGHRIMGELQDLELFLEKDSSNLVKLVQEKFIEDLKATNNILEVQVITALKIRGQLSIKNLNQILQKMYNAMLGESIKGRDDVNIFVGDKVINLKNNYGSESPKDENGITAKRPIFNGSIGIVKQITSKAMIVDFVGIGEVQLKPSDYSGINLAYAISAHSAQGSQWARVICAFDMSAFTMLNVEILYTALTRAMAHCSLIIEARALGRAIQNVEQKTKQTLLLEFLG